MAAPTTTRTTSATTGRRTPRPTRRSDRRRALLAAFTTPLRVDDFVALFDPMWSSAQRRGRIVAVTPGTGDGDTTVTIEAGGDWPGHTAGDHVTIAVELDGVLTRIDLPIVSLPADDVATFSVAVPAAADDTSSTTARAAAVLRDAAAVGTLVRLGTPEAAPAPAPAAQPVELDLTDGADTGACGRVRFSTSGVAVTADADAATPLLILAEEAGLSPKFGCRRGVCRACSTPLLSGTVIDMRDGTVTTADGRHIKVCVNAPVSDVDVAL